MRNSTKSTILDCLSNRYPGWKGFDDERFVADEITYKRSTVDLARELLAKEELSWLIGEKNFGELNERIERVGKDNNLLYNSVPTSGDLRILYNENANREAFYDAFLSLIHEKGKGEERLARFVEVLKGLGIKCYWSFPTYFMFIIDPENEFFVKPSVAKWFLEMTGNKYSSQVDAQMYKTLKEEAKRLQDEMNQYNPKNLIDIQSAIWVAYSESSKKLSKRYWKISPGENAWQWEECKRDGFIAIGWPELGDPSSLNEAEFKEKATAIEKELGGEYAKSSSSQVWKFRNIKAGDIIIANRGQKEVVGIGRVIEEYFFDGSEERYPHKLGVDWFDTEIRRVNKPGWVKTLIEIEYEEFEEISNAPGKLDGSTSAAKEVLQKILPIDREREAAVKFLAESVEYCNEKYPDCWEVSLFNHLIRLNVGRLYSLDLKEGSVMFFCNPDSLSDELKQKFSRYIKVYDEFRSLKRDVLQIELPSEVFVDSSSLFRNSHHAFLDLAMGTATTSPYKAAYSPGIIEFVNDMLNTSLPHPGFFNYRNIFFSAKTFELLKGIHNNPTSAFYKENRDDFYEYVEQPLKELLSGVVSQLPYELVDYLETDKYVMGKILKNDYGQGGAWDYAWGAFYPKGGKKRTDAQLYITLRKDYLTYGFSLGDYSSGTWKRLSENVSNNRSKIVELLGKKISDNFDLYGYESGGVEPVNRASNFEELVEKMEEIQFNVCNAISKEKLQSLEKEELVKEISEGFEILFPLVILATEENPMERIVLIVNPGINPVVNLDTVSEETGLDQLELATWVKAIRRKRQAVIYGPPGTGKTFVAKKLAEHIVGGGNGFIDTVQFHPSYSYEDFIMGIRPVSDENGNLRYPAKEGRFLEFCGKASKCEGDCVLIIDEINRANLSRVFGELMYVLEYRNETVRLAVDGKEFRIPENVYLLGTMNTADRTIALVDHALRRRFAFLKLAPKYEIMRHYHKDLETTVEPLISLLKRLNSHIEEHYQVGVSFFLSKNLRQELESIWKMEIEPYLEEYFFNQPDKVAEFRWDRVKIEIGLS